MRKILLHFRYFLEYALVWVPYRAIPLLPICAIRLTAKTCAAALWMLPGVRKLLRANIQAAMPEKSRAEAGKIGKASLFNLFFNMLEFVWIDGRPKRIEARYVLPEDITRQLKAHVQKKERIIFVNPHLGSWEASGTMAPYYAYVEMVAVAKRTRNPYLNRLINDKKRERTRGLKIIFSSGAMRSSIQSLKNGLGVGLLIDQNTRVRDGGVFVNFFDMPCPSSVAPATLKRYADAHDIPAVIIYGTSLRTADGKVTAHSKYLSKPFAEYADDCEVIEELMRISESFIRRYPEQYLWFYKRFQYISPDATEEEKKRYPYYATVPPQTFFRKIMHNHHAPVKTDSETANA